MTMYRCIFIGGCANGEIREVQSDPYANRPPPYYRVQERFFPTLVPYHELGPLSPESYHTSIYELDERNTHDGYFRYVCRDAVASTIKQPKEVTKTKPVEKPKGPLLRKMKDRV